MRGRRVRVVVRRGKCIVRVAMVERWVNRGLN
jgi:hypothetical protein